MDLQIFQYISKLKCSAQILQLMFDSHLADCVKQLAELSAKDVNKDTAKIDDILKKHCPITVPQLSRLPQIEFYREDLIQDKYIPSPDLLTSINTNFMKTFSVQPKAQNNKLKQLYGSSNIGRNTVDFSQMKYQSQNPLAKPSILVEQREETMLKQLKSLKIQATIPEMQQSLRMFQINSLEAKQIKLQNMNTKNNPNLIQNTETLQHWKKKRQKLMKNLSI